MTVFTEYASMSVSHYPRFSAFIILFFLCSNLSCFLSSIKQTLLSIDVFLSRARECCACRARYCYTDSSRPSVRPSVRPTPPILCLPRESE